MTTDYVNPYESLNNVNEDNQKRLQQINIGAAEVSLGGDVESTINATQVPSVAEIDANSVQVMNEEKALVRRMVVEEAAGLDRRDLLGQAIAAEQFGTAEDIAKAEERLRPFIAEVFNTPGSEGLTDHEVEVQAVNLYMLRGMAQIMDEMGGFDYALDMANMMFIPDASYNQSQIVEEEKFVNFFTSASSIQRMAEQANNLPPAQRLLYYESLRESLDSVESSEIQKFVSMLEFMGQNPYVEIEHAFDKFGFAEIGVGIAKGLFKGIKTLNVMRRMDKMKNASGAAATAEVASGNAHVARTVGVDQFDAASAGNPLKQNIKDVFYGAPEMPSGDIRNRIMKIDQHLEAASDTLGVSISLNRAEQKEQAARWVKHLSGQPDVENVQAVPGSAGVTVTYRKADDVVLEFHDYKLDDIGGFIDESMGAGARSVSFFASPAIKSGADITEMVDAPTNGLFRAAKSQANLDQAIIEAYKPIKNNKKSIEKVNDMLQRIDGRDDIVFNYNSMVNEGVGGLKLNEKEFFTAMGVRRTLDRARRINNDTIKAEMTVQGIKRFQRGGTVYYGKPYDDVNTAFGVYNNDRARNVTKFGDSGRENIELLTKETLEQFYNEGYRLVRSADDEYNWYRSSTNRTRYALVPNDEIKGLPEDVLNKVPNYLPKRREGANYFLKKREKITVDGKKKEVLKTRAWANTEAQANRWLDQAMKADPQMKRDDWVVLFDRESTAAKDSADMVKVKSQGLYRGKRSSEELTYAGDAVDGQRVDALTALQDYMRYTADRMNMSQWRMGMRERIYNEASRIDPKLRELPWNELRGAINTSNASGGRRSKLTAAIDQVDSVSSIPTKAEQNLQGWVLDAARYADRKGNEKVAQWLYSNKRADALGVARGMTFDLTLGMFNIAQIAVQASAMAVAVGANPVHFTKAFPKWLASSTLDYAGFGDAIKSKKLLNETAKRFGVEAKTLKNDYEFWRRSGMYDSVVRGDADASAVMGRLPYDANVVRRGWEKARDIGRTPYKAGELASMRASFFTALERQKTLDGKNFKYDVTTLEAVAARAEQYRLNMSAGNKANYQRGFWSLPAQFKSVYTKSLEAYLGGWFNGPEKTRIMLAQAMLYGAAGVPVVNYFADSIISTFLNPEEMTADEIIAAKRGAVGLLLNGYMDIDAFVSERLAIAPNLGEELVELFSGTTPLPQAMLGASFTSGDKAIDFFNNIMLAGKMIIEAEDVNETTLSAAGGLVARSLAQIPTSTRRLHEAYVLHALHEKQTANGVTLYQFEEEDVSFRDVMARSMGFSSQEYVDMLKSAQDVRKRKDKIRTKAENYVIMASSLIQASTDGDEGGTQAAHIVLSALKDDIDNDADRRDIWREVKNKMENQDMAGRVFKDWVDLYNSELISETNRLNPTLNKRYEETLQEVEE